MINAVRFSLAAVWATLVQGSRAIIASWRNLPDTVGGPYDQAAIGWSRMLLQGARIAVRVEGPAQLRPRPAVYVANHVSMIDIPVIVTALPLAPKFVMKKELLRVPLFGRAARAAGHIAVDRRNRSAAFAAYDEAAGTIRRGHPALVFAEGTRSRNGRLMPFKKGPFVLAIAARVPVVPLVVLGSYELMPRLSLSPQAGEVVLRVGPDLPTEGMNYDDRDRLSEEARRIMLELGAVE